MDKIELLDGAMRFDPYLIALDALLILHYIISYYAEYKKTKYKIDYWFISTSLSFFIPLLCLYPFSASIFNSIATKEMASIDPQVDRAYFISLIGYACLWGGRYYYDLVKKKSLLAYSAKLIERSLGRLIQYNIRSRISLFMLFFVFLSLFLTTFYYQVGSGNIFNPRSFFLAEHGLRPIYNATVTLYSIFAVYTGIAYLNRKSLWNRLAIVISIITGIFIGSRSAVIGSFVTVYTISMLRDAKQVSLMRLFFIALFTTVLLFIMDIIRSGGDVEPTFFLFNTSVSFLYGNTFSDLRDFAWVLAFWDKDFVYGKTYLAALLSFIPRFISDFRQEWAIGVYVSSIVGFNSETHAGIRPGAFGEAFLNFGHIGVMTVGFIYGYMTRYVDIAIKNIYMRSKNTTAAFATTSITIVFTNLLISASFFSLYFTLAINLLLFLCSSLARLLVATSPSKREAALHLQPIVKKQCSPL